MYFLAVQGLCCCAGFSLVAGSRGYSLLRCAGFSLQSTGAGARGLQGLKYMGSALVAPGL